MKITIIQYLIAVAMIGLLFACLLPMFRKHDSRKVRPQVRARVRPLSLFERCLIPFVQAMDSLSLWAHRNFTWFGGNRLALGNALLTMPGDSDSKLADEAIGRFKLVKPGSDADHIALCDAADIPHGFTRDGSAASGELVAFDYLGLAHKATQGTASGAVTAGNLVCPGANGVLRDITTLNGTTVYVCGRALTSAADGEAFVWVPYAPAKLVIA